MCINLRRSPTLTLKPYLNDIERCTCSSLLYNELHVDLIKIAQLTKHHK